MLFVAIQYSLLLFTTTYCSGRRTACRQCKSNKLCQHQKKERTCTVVGIILICAALLLCNQLLLEATEISNSTGLNLNSTKFTNSAPLQVHQLIPGSTATALSHGPWCRHQSFQISTPELLAMTHFVLLCEINVPRCHTAGIFLPYAWCSSVQVENNTQ